MTDLDPADVLVDPASLWRRISARVDERLQVVERAVVLLLERSLRAEELTTCGEECRLIAEWMFELDLAVAGRIIRSVGLELTRERTNGEEPLSSRDASGLAIRIEDFRRVLRVAGDDWLDRLPTGGHVHVVSLVDARVDAVMWHLRRLGLHVTHTPRFVGSPEHPDAMLLFWPGDVRDTSPALTEIGRRSWKTRRILLHAQDQGPESLAAVSTHADLLLAIGASPDVLADEIRSVVMPDASWVERVVVLDGPELAADLRRYHFEPLQVLDLEAAIDLLSTSDRTIVLGPGVGDPAAIIGLLRATPAIRDTVVAAHCGDALTAAKCRQLGADIILDGHDDVDTWGLHLRGLISRRNRARDFTEPEVVQIPAWSTTVVLFERALGSLGRTAGTASLALIQLPDDLTDERALEIRTAIGQEFRTVDLLGHSEDGLLMVLLRGATREAANARLHDALENVDLPRTSGRVGVAEFPIDGYALGELLSAAGSAADRALAADGPAVASSDWYPDQTERADVVLVESDHTLASILTQLLDQLGLTSEHILTGSDALRRFAHDGAARLPRLLIVELDAMGADGLMILRSLAQQGVLSRTRVLVTCARIRDGELREAFELGADDVVVKPFSAVVLSNRILQVLDER